MSVQYNGNPSNTSGSLFAATNILSSTNANPITVQTSSPHGLSSNDYVDIQGHQTNTSANGINKATVVDSTHFTIPVAGVGVGGSTGTVQSLALGATAPMPSDGDDDTGASVDVMFQRLADQTAFLGTNLGQYKLAQRSISFLSDATFGASWAHISGGTLTVGTPGQWISDGSGWSTPAGALSVPNTGGVAPVWSFSGVGQNDLIVATLQTTLSLLGNSPVRVMLYAAFTNPGAAAPTWPGGYSKMNGGSQAGGTSAAPANFYSPVTLIGTAPAGASVLWIQPIVLASITGAQTIQLQGDSTLIVDLMRPTGMKQ